MPFGLTRNMDCSSFQKAALSARQASADQMKGPLSQVFGRGIVQHSVGASNDPYSGPIFLT